MSDGINIKLPAEWEPQQAVIIAWPHESTDWQPRLSEVTKCYIDIAEAIARHVGKLAVITTEEQTVKSFLKDKVDLNKIIFVDYLTNDTWTRDFGPITTISIYPSITLPTFNDFQFNGWGMKFAASKDNQFTSHMYSEGIFSDFDYANNLDFVLEGGSIESDGCGLILTTSQCLLSSNRNDTLTPIEIENRLRNSLGAKKILWLDYGALEGDDTDSHVDTLARLISHESIAYSSCDRPTDNHFAELKHMEKQLCTMTNINNEPFNLFPLPIPEPIYDEEGNRLPATYANFLIVNSAVILPVYGDEKYDKIAVDQIRKAMPTYEIETVDCRELIRQHGSLHCATMQVPSLSF